MSTPKFGFTAKQIINDGRITWEDIDLMKTWLTTQNLPKLTDEQIVLFLLSCNNEQEPTQATIKSFYAVRNSAPGLFDNRTIKREDIQKQLKTVEFCLFPERTDDGCVVIYHGLQNTAYSQYEMEPTHKLLYMTLDAALYDYPPEGLIMLFNMKGMGVMHLTRFRLGLIKIFFPYLQKGLPLRLKSIHVLNTGYFIDKVMAIIKPFAKKEVLDMVHFHPADMDMELFYEKWVPKRCLPEDLGGDLPPVRDLHQNNIEKLTDMDAYFKEEELQRYSIT